MCCGSQTGHLAVSGHLLQTQPSPLQPGSGQLCPQPAPLLDLHTDLRLHTLLSPPKGVIKWAKSPFKCHLLLLFNEFSVVWCLAGVQPALNHTWVFYPWLQMMSLGFQLQHERVFVQLLSVVSHPSWWNSGRVSAAGSSARMVSNQILFTG